MVLQLSHAAFLVAKKNFFSRHAVDQSLPYRVLAACVSEGGVEIIESRVEKHIHHSLDSFNVDDALFLRQSHKTEAELFDVVKIFVMITSFGAR